MSNEKSNTQRAGILDKRQKICRDSKSRPLWELRTLKINPSERETLFSPSNALHTRRLSIVIRLISLFLSSLFSCIPIAIHLLFFTLEFTLYLIFDRVYFTISPYIPLFISVFISLSYRILDFVKLYNLGRLIDSQICYTVDPRRPRVVSTKWSDLSLGSILRLSPGEKIPADIILISTTSPNGLVCVDTSLVDGSVDLSIKTSIRDFNIEPSLHSISRLRGDIVCNKPNISLDFEGTLKLKGFPRSTVLTNANFVERGSIIRNAKSVYGVVVYTGLDTKLGRLSNLKPSIKKSLLEKDVNRFTIFLLIFYLFCWLATLFLDHTTGVHDSMKSLDIAIKFLKFASLYMSIFPNTLNALFDLNRLIQSTRMCLYEKSESNIIPVRDCHVEDLGLVDFIFTGDRGILIDPKPEISFVIIDDEIYNFTRGGAIQNCFISPSGTLECLNIDTKPFNEKGKNVDLFLKLSSMCNISTTPFGPTSDSISNYFVESSASKNTFKSMAKTGVVYPFSSSKSLKLPQTFKYLSRRFRRVRAKLSHLGFKVRIKKERPSHHSFSNLSSVVNIDYMSLYPEDGCLVGLAFDHGYKLLHKTSTSILLLANGKAQGWEIVDLHTPSLTHSRITLVLRPILHSQWEEFFGRNAYNFPTDPDHEKLAGQPNGSGALVISKKTTSEYNKDTSLNLNNDSSDTLKEDHNNLFKGFTFVELYYRWLSENELQEYLLRKNDTSKGFFCRDEQTVESLLEDGLQIVATVGFKNGVFENVLETIAQLTASGIRFCLSTPSPLDYAISHAYSSGLLNNSSHIYTIDSVLTQNYSVEPFQSLDQLSQSYHDVHGTESWGSYTAKSLSSQILDSFYRARNLCWNNNDNRSAPDQLCLTLSGSNLTLFLSQADLENCLVNMLCFSDIIIAHDMSAHQKASLVKLITDRLTPTPSVLSLGYCYDDICILESAHIAVSVAHSKNEAPLSCYSNYVVSGVSDLERLLFCHGSLSLVAFSIILSQTIYACIMQGVIAFLYQCFISWISIPVYPHILLHSWTALVIFFSSLHVSSICRVAPCELMKKVPLLYLVSRRRYYINRARFFIWVFEGIISGFAIFFTMKVAMDDSPYLLRNLVGDVINFDAFISLLSISVLIVTNIRAISNLNIWSLHSYGVVEGPVTVFFLFGPILVSLGTTALFGLSNWPYTWVLISLWTSASLMGAKLFSFIHKRVQGDILGKIHSWVALALRDSERKLVRYNPKKKAKALDTYKQSKWYHSLKFQVWELSNEIVTKCAASFSNAPLEIFSPLPSARPFAVIDTPEIIRHEDESLPESRDHIQTLDLLNRFTLWFKDPQLELEYSSSRKFSGFFSHVKWYRAVFIIFLIFLICSWVLEYFIATSWDLNVSLNPMLFASLSVVAFILTLACLTTFNAKFFKKYFKIILVFVVFTLILQNITFQLITSKIFFGSVDSGLFHSTLFPVFTFVILRLPFLAAFLSNVVYYIIGFTTGQLSSLGQEIPLYIGINLFVFLVGYRLEYSSRKSFILEYAAASARRRQREILDTMLPSFVVANMVANSSSFSITSGLSPVQQRSAVTVVFCDVYKFQNWVASLEPTKLVELLDMLFLSFDKCALQFSCTKIETVFESYLVASGLSLDEAATQESPQTSAAKAIDMALAMLEYVALANVELPNSKDKLEVVIGIHTGPIISGVVGTRKPQYALFGDTVNTASRMKYTGQPSHIHISADAHVMVADDSSLIFERRETSVKGKGIMETFLLRSVIGLSYPNYQKSQTFLDDNWSERVKSRYHMIRQALGSLDEGLESAEGDKVEVSNAVEAEVTTDDTIANIDSLFLSFSDQAMEEKYRLNFYSDKSNIGTIEQTIVIFLIIFVIQTFTSMGTFRKFFDPEGVNHIIYFNYLPYWSVRSGYTICAFVLWFYFHHLSSSDSTYVSKWMVFFISPLFVSAACIFSLSNSWAISKDTFESHNLWLSCDSIEFYFYVCLLHNNAGMLFQTCVLVDVLLIIVSITFILSSVLNTALTGVTLFYIPCFVIFNLISAHCKESIDRRAFYANERAKTIQANASQLLSDMLPKNVLEEFQMDKLQLAYRHDNMAFLFADIVGFTTWAKSVDASEVLNMLQNLFAKFDKNTIKFGLYKLCTIGDAYVAVSEPDSQKARAADPSKATHSVIMMAKSMLSGIQEVRERLGIPALAMRIGLHFGSAVGGVIGSGRLRYDLWGMDILTANMMESNGVSGRINVSERFKDILSSIAPGQFGYTFNKDVLVIDKQVKSYLLEFNN